MYEITLAQKNKDYDYFNEIKAIVTREDALAFISNAMNTFMRQGVSVTVTEVREEDK